MRYFISAGEASGDIHAAELMHAIKGKDPEATFTFLGGDAMAEAAESKPVIHIRDMAFMGFSEVLRNLGRIRRNFARARQALKESHADALIIVDYPGFNLKFADTAARQGLPVYCYISPKVWAWKSWRVRKMRRLLRKVLSILPFEPGWFAKRGVEVEYVGNPSVEEIDRRIAATTPLESDKPILALVPGSRRGEIRCNLPIMAAVAALHPEMKPLIAGAPGISPTLYGTIAPGIEVVTGQTTALMLSARAALVTSGTATLECALCATPQVACYRANGSAVSYHLMSLLIKIPFVTLPNLVAEEEVIPELLVHKCTVESVNKHLSALLPEGAERAAQLEGYGRMRKKLGTRRAAISAAEAIVSDLKSLNDTKK